MQKQLLARLFAAPVKTIPNNLSKHGTQGAVSNLVSGGDARLPGVLALQRRWCWREADAGSGLEERTAGTSELLEDRDLPCQCCSCSQLPVWTQWVPARVCGMKKGAPGGCPTSSL